MVVFICSFASCTPHIPTELEKQIATQFVHEDVFLTITNGSSFAEVKKTLGNAVRHQFTVSESGHTWMLILCYLHIGTEEGYNFYQLLFCDGVLSKTIGNVSWLEMEEVPYRGTTWRRPKPWGIEDLTGVVQKVLDAPAMTHDRIRAELKNARETMEKYKGHGNIPAVVFNLFAPVFIRQAQTEYPINEELRQRYDGCRAVLGISVQEVDALYGKPLWVFTTKSGLTARIYGDHRYVGNMNHFLCFSNVAVLFDSGEHVARIYSGQFFCDDWDPVLQQRKKANERE